MDDLLTITIAVLPLLAREEPIPQHTSILTGNKYYWELTEHPNPHQSLDVSRFKSRDSFIEFLDILKRKRWSEGRKVPAGQKLLMFISALRENTFRVISDRWQVSTATVHSAVLEMSLAILSVFSVLSICPIRYCRIQSSTLTF
jgi:hypothetical protein